MTIRSSPPRAAWTVLNSFRRRPIGSRGAIRSARRNVEPLPLLSASRRMAENSSSRTWGTTTSAVARCPWIAAAMTSGRSVVMYSVSARAATA